MKRLLLLIAVALPLDPRAVSRPAAARCSARAAGQELAVEREIAKEAEGWGQEDDITMVQVAYA